MTATTRRSFIRGFAAAIALGVARTPIARALGATAAPLVEREPPTFDQLCDLMENMKTQEVLRWKANVRDVVLWGGPGHGKRISGVYAARLELPVYAPQPLVFSEHDIELLRGPEFIDYVTVRNAEGQPLVVTLPLSAWSAQATEPASFIVYARSATLPDNTTIDDVITDLEQTAHVLRYAFHQPFPPPRE